MPTIQVHLVAADGATTTLEGRTGDSLMETAIAANTSGIEADCGGLMTCATCHVYVREPFAAQLPAPEPDEIAMLEFTAAPRKSNSRLSCQIALQESLDGLTVDLPDTQH